MGSAGHQGTAQDTSLSHLPPALPLPLLHALPGQSGKLFSKNWYSGIYLIHSVLLDSILATKALGIIYRTGRSESHTGVKMLEMGGRREQWKDRPEDRNVKNRETDGEV